jgi:4-oxalocrotonate tautomerase
MNIDFIKDVFNSSEFEHDFKDYTILIVDGSDLQLPNIKITKEGNVTPEQKAQLIEGATNLLHEVLGKNKATTVVVIDEVDTDNWGIGGIPVTEIRKTKK